MNKLKLTKPLKLHGMDGDRELTELPYDFDSMTARDKINAGKHMRAQGLTVAVEELDTDYHLFLFAQAVAKADPTIDVSDVLKISAKDSQKASEAARNFFYLDSEE